MDSLSPRFDKASALQKVFPKIGGHFEEEVIVAVYRLTPTQRYKWIFREGYYPSVTNLSSP